LNVLLLVFLSLSHLNVLLVFLLSLSHLNILLIVWFSITLTYNTIFLNYGLTNIISIFNICLSSTSSSACTITLINLITTISIKILGMSFAPLPHHHRHFQDLHKYYHHRHFQQYCLKHYHQHLLKNSFDQYLLL
jgi:hypothetical protein